MNHGPIDSFNNGKLPNHQSALVLGIISIVLAFCCPLLALIPGIIGLLQANKSKALYEVESDRFSPSSYSQIKTSRLLCIIGIALTICMFIYTAFSWNQAWPEILEAFEEAKNQ